MVLPDHKMIFLLPPKCGTSSFISLLKDNPEFNSAVIINQDKNRHMVLSHKLRKFNIKLQDFKTYQLCRHPLNRLISSYHFHKRPTSETETIFVGDGKYARIYEFNEFLELALPIIIDSNSKPNKRKFISWNRTISKDLHINHFFYKPQMEWNDLNVNVEYLKLEDLMQDTSKLFPILGESTPKKYPIKNKNKKLKNPTLEIFTKQNLELAYEAYEQDFKILGYK